MFLSNRPEVKSYVQFGAPDTSQMKNENNLVYIELQDDLFWSASCQGFAFGELSNDYKVPDLQTSFVRDGRIYSTFDSGSAQIQMPDPLFEPFVRQIFEKAGVSADDY